MTDLIVIKYRFRFFLKFYTKVLYVLICFITIFILYLCFFEKNNALYNKRINLFKNVSVFVSDNLNSDICNNFYVDGILYSNYSNIQKNVNKYCNVKDFNINDLKNNILKDPWIKNLTIYKKYPNKLEIKIIEYNPFAVWINNQNEYKLIDEYGNIINITTTKVKQFKNLVIIVGDNIKSEIHNMFNLLSIYNNVSNNLLKIIRISDRRWNLILKNGLIVKLPEENKNFFKIWKDLDRIINIYQNDNNLEIIDLRIKNKIYLKYKNEINV